LEIEEIPGQKVLEIVEAEDVPENGEPEAGSELPVSEDGQREPEERGHIDAPAE
jgi:hypothetical protein